ncbi:YiiX/YebB-like N1pC/P60 family cysteine hydrolase [Chryseobacterium sp. RR2-3-20]|uniref:YiiX/YebB-like N1pC/P60 family cysteine hydrolase n=1 Tax=Chryseobacterium sp. RR2-3-20 TaxID=2787626 RepID=UPI001ADF7C52|nr:YiiX/YebB-like N1pC/P60 family cysteine hydrolase [Chryseobacterium sp. RR2-3-20]
MWKYLIILILFSCCSSKEQISTDIINNVNPEKNFLYIIYRKTDTKNGIVAQSYNQYGSTMSHVSIGVVSNHNEFNVFHLLKKKGRNIKNDFWISDLKGFFDDEDENITGAEIWKSNFQLSSQQLSKIKFTVDSLNSSPIKFDFSFDFENHDKMYCSEFVYFVLNKIDFYKYDKVSLCSKEISGIHKSLLGTSVLYYLPVDFLYVDQRFVKIYSKEFKER